MMFQDLINNDAVNLDDMFKVSLIGDLIKVTVLCVTKPPCSSSLVDLNIQPREGRSIRPEATARFVSL